jgi:flavodoxin
MNILLVYYSRSGATKKLAEEIRQKLNCDIEEIISQKDRSGIMGLFLSGREASQKIPADIKPVSKNIRDYDLVIVGTPIWAGISSPIRRYLLDNAGNFKKIALFCTMGGSDPAKTFAEAEDICQSKAIATLAVTGKEIARNSYTGLNEFIEKINKNV